MSMAAKAFAAVIAAAALSACDEDVNKSMVLSGQWEGDFGMYYDYTYNGETIRFDCYDTRLVFYPDYDYATHGYGKEVDYYDYGPYEYQYYYFNWEIRDGIVYLDYPYDRNLSTQIYDYRMNDFRFTGHFGNSDSKFRLNKIADYYCWDPYYDYYMYGWRNNWYYSWYNHYYYTRSADNYVQKEITDADNSVPQEYMITRGNRFNN